MRLKAGFLLSTVSVLALSGTASAQTWTGFYLGGHSGAAWLRHEQTLTSSNFTFLSCSGAVVLRSTCAIRDTGAVLGAQAGYNWQVQQVVFGVESDISWTTLDKSVTSYPGPGAPYVVHARIDWLASVRGRLGWAANDWLFYGTGGVAFMSFAAGHERGPTTADSIDKTKSGWVVGGGVEKMMGRNWSARAEFLRYGFGRATSSKTVFVVNTYTTSFRNDVSVVRLGVNFRPNP